MVFAFVVVFVSTTAVASLVYGTPSAIYSAFGGSGGEDGDGEFLKNEIRIMDKDYLDKIRSEIKEEEPIPRGVYIRIKELEKMYILKCLTLRSRGGLVTNPLEVFPICFKNPKFLLLVVPTNLRKLYCGNFGIKIFFSNCQRCVANWRKQEKVLILLNFGG